MIGMPETAAGGVDSSKGIEDIVRGDSREIDDIRRFIGPNWDLILKEHDIRYVHLNHCEALYKEKGRTDTSTHVYDDTFLIQITYSSSINPSVQKSVNLQKYNGNLVLMREIEKPEENRKGLKVIGVWDYDISQRFKDEYGHPELREIAEPKLFHGTGISLSALAAAVRYVYSVIDHHDAATGKVSEQNGHVEGIIKDSWDQNRFRVFGSSIEFLFDYSPIDYRHLNGFNGLHKEIIEHIKVLTRNRIMEGGVGDRLMGIMEANQHFLNSAKNRYKPHYVKHEDIEAMELDKVLAVPA